MKELIAELEEEDDGRPKFNNARTSRIAKLNDEFMEKEISGSSVKDIISGSHRAEELPTKHMKVTSINEEWDEVKFTNFQEVYNINSDIFAMLASLSTKSYPVSILDVKIEDTSTAMDYIDTYTVQMEDGYGKRFSLVFDIPKFKNKRFMRLRGNEKISNDFEYWIEYFDEHPEERYISDGDAKTFVINSVDKDKVFNSDKVVVK